jgi:ceramide glucosyltransferase
VLRDAFGILTVLSLALTVWRWALHRRFPLHHREVPPTALPGVTFLKPLKGVDAFTRECLRSWFEQTYPGPTQILLGVASLEDPVCAIARELLAEFRGVDAHLVVCGENLGHNPKVSTLRQLEPLIKHPLLIISDADVRAPRDFAASMAPLCQPDVGLVNCFYRLANPATTAMRWEAMAINADFWTQVLQAESLRKIDFALGAAMTLPTSELQAMGGFAALSDYLADDYQLGHRIAERGRRIVLGTVAVDCWEAPAGWGAVWRHQLRWARTIRACQPAPFFFSVINNSSIWPLGLLALCARGPAWGLALGGGALAFRVFTAQQQQARLAQNWSHGPYAWLVPVKDILDFVLWLAALGGNQIEWRGERFRIAAGGKLAKV